MAGYENILDLDFRVKYRRGYAEVRQLIFVPNSRVRREYHSTGFFYFVTWERHDGAMRNDIDLDLYLLFNGWDKDSRARHCRNWLWSLTLVLRATR